MNDRELRLECLRAAISQPGIPPSKTLEQARQYWEFVTGLVDVNRPAHSPITITGCYPSNLANWQAS